MNMSDDIAELATALAKAQGEIQDATKGAENPYFKSKYADLSAVRSVIREPLARNGLSVVQLPSTVDGGAIVQTILMHQSGQYISNELFMPAGKTDPHGLGSAITYARRYSIMSILCLAAEDDDGNAAVNSVKRQPAKQTVDVTMYVQEGNDVALSGTAELTNWWKTLPADVRNAIPSTKTAEWKKIASAASNKDA
jgi:hypothetical protein